MKDCSFAQESFFIGFDSSTQSLKTTVLNSNLNIVTSEIVNSDSELPHYKTKEGVYRDPSVDGQIVSPTLIWVEAFDLILQRLEKYKLDFGKIVVVSGNGQQHGSVYWKMGSSAILSSLDLKKPLVDQLRDAFSINELPIWMNSSTTEQCIAIEKTIGGAMELSKFTGSRAHERYTGPQIRRIFETQPKIYQNTERISLVSSFMASILIGEYACIDQTDGAGMNLMDTKQRNWSKIALGATTPGLEKKFGKLAPAHVVAGFIDPYFVERFNFNKSYLVVQWSGDKPNTLAGLTLNTLGDLAISLGTNDTVFGITTEHKLSLEGHVFLNPVDTKVYMVMLCYKNGSLAREEGRNRCANKSWETFNIFLEQIPPLNGGKLDFYYRDHEILPPLPVGFHHYILSNFDGDTLSGLIGQEVKDFNPPSEVRAGQFLSMRAHAESFGMPSPPNRILTTGGASANDTILNSIASIFGLHAITSELHHKHYKDATYGMFLHEYGKETTDAYEVVTFNKVIHVRFPSCQQLLNFLKIAKSDRGAKSPADISLNINYFQVLLIEIARQTRWQHLIGFNGAPSIVKNDACIQLVFTVNINSFCKKVQVIEQEIFEEIRRHGLKVAVPGIPKTINNDIPIIDKSFGFDTAIKEAQRSIIAAHVKVESVDNGIGLVKFRGHYNGFIAMYAITASRDADRSCYFAYLPP